MQASETVGKRIATLLQQNGVGHVFGVPGGQTYALYMGLGETPGIEHVLMHDERSAGFAADGYARVTGGLGVCDATVGPGATNLPSAIAEAYAASVPLLGIIADIPRAWEHLRNRGNASQAIGQSSMFAEMTKWQARLDFPDAVDDVIRAAVRVMRTGRPGPVILTIPEDVFFSTDRVDTKHDIGRGLDAVRSGPDPAQLARACRALSRSRRPVIIAGGGAIRSGAMSALRQLAERLTCPVATTISGKGSISETHSLSVGVMGSMGRKVANDVVAEADCVLVVGSKLGQVATSGWEIPRRDVPIIHIDVDPEELGRVFLNTIPLAADAALALDQLNAHIDTEGSSDWDVADIEARVTSWYRAAVGDVQPEGQLLRPQRVVHCLNQFIEGEDLLVTDASISGGWGSAYTNTSGVGTVFLAGRGLAGLGWGLPAALGACIGRQSLGNQGRTYLLAGDGGFSYSVQELEVASRLDLPLTCIVLNNSCLGWVKHTATARFGEAYSSVGTEYSTVDFSKIANGFNVPSRRVRTESELQLAMKDFSTTAGPTLIEVLSDQWESPVIKLAESRNGGAITGEGL